jgi:hypothetical protein
MVLKSEPDSSHIASGAGENNTDTGKAPMMTTTFPSNDSASTSIPVPVHAKRKPYFPTEKRILPGALSTKEMEIYNLSDSEDERVELTKFHGGIMTGNFTELCLLLYSTIF